MERIIKREAPEAVEIVKKRLDVYFDIDSRRQGLALKAQPDDVILSDAQKSGTTWIRQVSIRNGWVVHPVVLAAYSAPLGGSRRLYGYQRSKVHEVLSILIFKCV